MEPTLLHRQTLTECNLQADSLPEGLKSKVSALEQKISDFEKSPTAEEKGKIETISGKLAHAIKDFSENERPDDVTPPVVEEVPPIPPVVEEVPPIPPVVEEVPPVEGTEEDEGGAQGNTFLQRRRIDRSR